MAEACTYPMARVLERRVVIPHGEMRAPVVGFVTYVHPTQPRLIRRHGWEVSDDIHDDFYDLASDDNGVTWSVPVRSVVNYREGDHYIVHTENAVLYLPQRDRLVVITNMIDQPALDRGHELGRPIRLRITVSAPGDYLRAAHYITDFDLPRGLAVSFCQPIEDSRGRLLVPVQYQAADTDGALRRAGIRVQDSTGLAYDYGRSALMIGTFDAAGAVNWSLGEPVPIEMGLSSRGLYEGAIAELGDGRLVMILRGSNHLWPDRPGCKWLSLSDDGGQSWSAAQPLQCDDGTLIESSATGSAIIRSAHDGRLYWLGNLCIDGRRPDGNMPRSPLVIAELAESPVALRRETIRVIDRAAPHEHPDTQHSNFKLYQDRATGDLVLYLTRYGERGYADNAWLKADHYQYRVAMG